MSDPAFARDLPAGALRDELGPLGEAVVQANLDRALAAYRQMAEVRGMVTEGKEVDAADYTVWRDTLGSTTDLRANGNDTGDSYGVIDEAEAQRRRSEITQQADFFGAMDGASKFVRGDAIAGILITLVNILGAAVAGMIPGMLLAGPIGGAIGATAGAAMGVVAERAAVRTVVALAVIAGTATGAFIGASIASVLCSPASCIGISNPRT